MVVQVVAEQGAESLSHSTKDLLALAIGPACHELRSPLAVVFGFAKMLERDDKLDERTHKYIEAIANGAERIDGLLDALSKIGRIAAGRMQPTLQHVPLAAVINDVSSTSVDGHRVVVTDSDDVEVHVDPEWLADALRGVTCHCCFDESVQIRVSWQVRSDSAEILVEPTEDVPLLDTNPEKAELDIALARMRIAKMGGTLEGDTKQICISVPR